MSSIDNNNNPQRDIITAIYRNIKKIQESRKKNQNLNLNAIEYSLPMFVYGVLTRYIGMNICTHTHTHIGIQFCNKSVISCIAKLWLKGCFYVIKMHNKKAKSDETETESRIVDITTNTYTHSWTNTSNMNILCMQLQLA